MDHLRRRVGVHVKRGELLTDDIDGLLSLSHVELNVINSLTKRNRTDVLSLHPWGRGAGKLQDSVGIDVVCAPVNNEANLIRSALQDRRECEAAGLAAKGNQSVRAILRIVFLHVS